MVQAVQDYIKSLNWNYKNQFREKGIVYENSLASFRNKNELKILNTRNQREVSRKFADLTINDRSKSYLPETLLLHVGVDQAI